MYDHILLPTDGSENAARAVDQAIEFATTCDATLHVLYVVALTPMLSDSAENLMSEQLEHTGHTVVDDIAEQAEQAGVHSRTVVIPGDPAREILTYAEEHAIDLIVMGTRGRTGFDRLLIGSVTEKVMRQAEVAVLTVRMS